MSVSIVTGSAGLVGAEATRDHLGQGLHVVGIDNDMRARFFGPEASTGAQRDRLIRDFPEYEHLDLDIRDAEAVDRAFARFGSAIVQVVHTAAQPSHDWAASEPFTDFQVNANGTLHLLEATRRHCPEATFIFTSTNKVYGDTPNRLPLVERATRWEVYPAHAFAAEGIDETMSVDRTLHSLFGASKLAADVLAQEYARYFGLRTGIFRCGCLTGPGHAGARLHGFLSWMMKCAVAGRPYEVYGYKGKQVRDNLHSRDLVQAFAAFHQRPRPGEVYNLGGGRFSHSSLLEAAALCGELAGRPLDLRIREEPRTGDHIWWVSDTRKFRAHYPEWSPEWDVPAILRDLHAAETAG